MAEQIPYRARVFDADGEEQQSISVWAPALAVAVSGLAIDPGAASLIVDVDIDELNRATERAAAVAAAEAQAAADLAETQAAVDAEAHATQTAT
ncbi:MAG: hypothetical protein ACRCW4_14535 [Candidatus Neomicrothrix subdominans]